MSTLSVLAMLQAVMPKVRKPEIGHYFGQLELAAASGLTKRNLQHLTDAGLMPPSRDTKALKRLAVIGAFAPICIGPVVAARLVEALLLAFNQSDGEVHSGLQFAARNFVRDETARLPSDNDEYSLFEALHPTRHYPHGTMPSDAIVEIKDFGDERRRIFLTPHETKIRSIDIDGEPADAEFIGWLEGWGRGSDDVRVVHASERISFNNPEVAKDIRDVYKRTDVVSSVRVNVSLAIRRAFERLARYRQERQ